MPYNIQVSQTLNTRANGYCYYYNRFSSIKKQTINIIANEINKNNNVHKGNSRMMNVNADGTSESILGDEALVHANSNNIALRNKIQRAVNAPMNIFEANSFLRPKTKKIATVKPLSEKFIEMNHLDINFIRQQEKDIRQVINVLNLVEN
ncbi:hypothetical protein K502DRAFT_354030 [Neoconidiobolus thromboides FSU 785]|nr:hypothetical protein K502DRAFT_354030 [Neoconidiobolus thromboides FSU 785]